MKSTLIFSPIVAAVAVSRAPRDGASGFTLTAIHSTSPIHQQPVTASNGQFFIGKNTSASCPSANGCGAYTTTETVLSAGTDNAVMDVAVPGGQLVFVQQNGVLGFSAPHSDAAPAGAYTTGFSLTIDQITHFNYTANGSSGFFACSTNESCKNSAPEECAPWQVYVGLPGVNTTGCISFDAIAEQTTAVAYEYD